MYLAVERSATDIALDEMERVFNFVLGRVGSRADAEDVTQQAALKALPRLRKGASAGEIRAYLFSAARSALAVFWSERYRLPQSELLEDATDPERGRAPEPSMAASAWLEATLAALPVHYRQVLELRFLRGCSIRETAREMGKTSGAVKVMQLRALRAAGQVSYRPPTRPARPLPAAARDFAFATRPEAPAVAATR